MGNINLRKLQRQKNSVEYAPSFSAPNASILIIDDNEMNLKVSQGLLQQTNIQIDTGSSGRDCLEMITKKHYDIIFLDHMMPEMDGIETIKEMHRQEHLCKDVPVIILTANAVVGAKEMYLSEGFTDYLSKPVSGKTLETTIRHYLPKKLLCPVRMDTSEPKAPQTHTTDVQPRNNSITLTEINREQGLSYSGNLEDLYDNLLNLFHNSLEEKIAAIENAYQKQDWYNYQVLVHALKSTAKSIGAQSLSDNAKELEFAAKDVNTDYIHKHHSKTMQHYRAVAKECVYATSSAFSSPK
jgi:CheY-like chemotaxis protein